MSRNFRFLFSGFLSKLDSRGVCLFENVTSFQDTIQCTRTGRAQLNRVKSFECQLGFGGGVSYAKIALKLHSYSRIPWVKEIIVWKSTILHAHSDFAQKLISGSGAEQFFFRTVRHFAVCSCSESASDFRCFSPLWKIAISA